MLERETKIEAIAKVLLDRSLNKYEALTEYGDSCLNTTVSQLKQRGWVIDKWQEQAPTRYGKGKTKVTRYKAVSAPTENGSHIASRRLSK